MQPFEILLYTAPEGKTHIEVFYEEESFWLSQKKMAELFGVDVRTVNEHLQNVFNTRELDENSVIRNFRITANDGKNYLTKFYNLDAIIAVGYRVNSMEATRFRIWATKTLREFIIKGFVLDDERLKQGKNFGKDYFDELLERIREIRASILKTDVTIAKNYLSENELDELNRIVSMYLDYADNQAKRQIPMTMKDWVDRLDGFLQFNEYVVLKDSGRISAEIAKKLAEQKFDQFRIVQDREFQSDFDETVKRLESK